MPRRYQRRSDFFERIYRFLAVDTRTELRVRQLVQGAGLPIGDASTYRYVRAAVMAGVDHEIMQAGSWTRANSLRGGRVITRINMGLPELPQFISESKACLDIGTGRTLVRTADRTSWATPAATEAVEPLPPLPALPPATEAVAPQPTAFCGAIPEPYTIVGQADQQIEPGIYGAKAGMHTVVLIHRDRSWVSERCIQNFNHAVNFFRKIDTYEWGKAADIATRWVPFTDRDRLIAGSDARFVLDVQVTDGRISGAKLLDNATSRYTVIELPADETPAQQIGRAHV